MHIGAYLKDCPAYYGPYLAVLDPEMDLLEYMKRQLENFPQFLRSIPEDKWGYRYGPDKWTLAEVIVHILDAERVFQYRALRFGRKDATPLPGFDQDAYVPESKAADRSGKDLIAEYEAIRQSSILLFEQFTSEDLAWKGTASGQPMSLGALGAIICGHQRHHRDILRARYLDR